MQKTSFFQNIKLIYLEAKVLYLGKNPVLSKVKQILIVCWCLPFQNRASDWLRATHEPLLARELARIPRIRQCLYCKYVNKRWKAAERMSAIEEHYRLIRCNAPILNLAPKEYIDLLDLDSHFKHLRVVLDRPVWMRREGEIGVSLFIGADRVYTAMFLLRGTPDNMKLVIGCVQGAHMDTATNLYKDFTKGMHGMRPRDFLLNMVTIIAKELGCKEILGISDKAHFSSHWYSRAFKHAIYDSIWLEHDGKLQDSGFFSLPTDLVKRADSEITTKKRALYRRRYELLGQLQGTLRRTLLSHPKIKHHN